MIFTLIFLTGVLAIAGWWLMRQGLATKPWLETGTLDELPAASRPRVATAKIGLGVFIAVTGSLLVLLISAYSIRMQMSDWSPPPLPQLLWTNTAVLVLSSVALHWARSAARRGSLDGVKDGLLAGGMGAVVFLLGQILAWRQLSQSGYLLATNPAHAFFYLVTAAHALHVIGGLVALGRAGARLRNPVRQERLRLSVELCSTYWHFLLVAWLALFGMLVVSPSFAWIYAICTAPFR